MRQEETTRSLTPGQSASAQPVSPERRDFNEHFGGFSLTRFDGTSVVIGA